MRKIDLVTLNFWLLQQGPRAKEDLASKLGMSFYTLRRILKGEKEPKGPEQIALCQVTGLLKDELFPVCEARKETA